MNTPPHTPSTYYPATSRYLLIILLLVGLVVMLLPACEHETFPPIDPDPMDTMDVDTMDKDTLGVPCDHNIVYFDRDLLPIQIKKKKADVMISIHRGIILEVWKMS